MELSQEEKERIIAEEKLRFETKRQLIREQWGGPWSGWGRGYGGWGNSCGHRGGFWRGLFVGLLVWALFSFCGHHHRCWYGQGACQVGMPNAQSAPQAEPKK